MHLVTIYMSHYINIRVRSYKFTLLGRLCVIITLLKENIHLQVPKRAKYTISERTELAVHLLTAPNATCTASVTVSLIYTCKQKSFTEQLLSLAVQSYIQFYNQKLEYQVGMISLLKLPSLDVQLSGWNLMLHILSLEV